MFRFWERVRGERAAPERGQIDLKQLRSQIGDLFLIERQRETYRWRLAGTRICELYRRELTGEDTLAGIDAFERDVFRRFLTGVIENLQPCVLRFRLTTSHGHMIGVEMIGLPIQSVASDTIHIFGGVFTFRDIGALTYNRIVNLELSNARFIRTDHLPGDELVAKLRTFQAFGPIRPFKVVTGGRTQR